MQRQWQTSLGWVVLVGKIKKSNIKRRSVEAGDTLPASRRRRHRLAQRHVGKKDGGACSARQSAALLYEYSKMGIFEIISLMSNQNKPGLKSEVAIITLARNST